MDTLEWTIVALLWTLDQILELLPWVILFLIWRSPKLQGALRRSLPASVDDLSEEILDRLRSDLLPEERIEELVKKIREELHGENRGRERSE